MPLTNLTISGAKPNPNGKPMKLFDGKGLFLLVTKSGAKYWRMKYRWAGKEKTLAFGVYPEVSLKEARGRCEEARRMLGSDVDPGEKKKADKLAARRAAESGFEAIALEWHRAKSAEWAPKHAASVLRTLELYLFPDLRNRPVAEIEPLELLEVLRKVEKAGKLDTAKRLRERCDAIFRLAVVTGRAKHNPAADLTDTLQANISKPRPALSHADLPAFLSELKSTNTITPHTRALFTVVMVCFTRIGETVRAKWEHFDLEKAVWTIPPENRKLTQKRKATAPAHVVPLPRQVVEAIDSLQSLRRTSPYVFPNVRHQHKHMSEATPLKALERMGYGGKNKKNGSVVTHGFRATASTILNEVGFNPDAIERQLSHTEANQVRAAYNRAQYLEERRRMLQCWADYLDSMTDKGASAAFPELPGNNGERTPAAA